MTGEMRRTPRPTDIRLHQQSGVLEVTFDTDETFAMTCEFLRVHSPSAEVRGHGAGQEVLQTGKKNVLITAIEPVGHYAVKLIFSDGHDSGIYSWETLYMLGSNQVALWEKYLARLEAAGASREADASGPAPSHSCTRH